jgi:gluconate 2-dehydrogenase alpha chain
VRKPNFAARDNSEVIRINVDKSGKKPTGVTFVDSSGQEWEQPAELVILSAFALFNVQLLLHSQIGRPYDPTTKTGTVGRNYTHQTVSTVNGFFDPKKFINPFITTEVVQHRILGPYSNPAELSKTATIATSGPKRAAVSI